MQGSAGGLFLTVLNRIGVLGILVLAFFFMRPFMEWVLPYVRALFPSADVGEVRRWTVIVYFAVAAGLPVLALRNRRARDEIQTAPGPRSTQTSANDGSSETANASNERNSDATSKGAVYATKNRSVWPKRRESQFPSRKTRTPSKRGA